MTDPAPLEPHHAHLYNGVILSVPCSMLPRDIIIAIKELERMALEHYVREHADQGGT